MWPVVYELLRLGKRIPAMYRLIYYLQNIHGVGGMLAALLALLGFAFSLWMAYDCWQRGGEIYWIWLILCSGGFFAVLYFFTHYWEGSHIEYGLWKRLSMAGRIRELEGQTKRLNTAASYEVLGDAYLSVGRFPQAEAAYREALQRQPDIFDVQVRLGYALLEMDRADEAWPLLGKAYQQKPDYDNDQLIWKLARCQARRGNHQDARNLYEYFLRKHSYSEVQIEYAHLLVQMGEREEGKSKLEELINDIEYSPRNARSRERRWSRAAKRLLRALNQPARS
jgi:hypothetical protein